MTAVSTTPTSGRIVTLMHDSVVLRDNPLGDPHQRKLSAYLPAAYDAPRNARRRFITLYDLAGFTSSGLSHLNWRNFDERTGGVPSKRSAYFCKNQYLATPQLMLMRVLRGSQFLSPVHRKTHGPQ